MIIEVHRVHPNPKWHTPLVLAANPAQDFPPPSVEYPLAALIGDVDLGVAHSKGQDCQASKFHQLQICLVEVERRKVFLNGTYNVATRIKDRINKSDCTHTNSPRV